MVGASVKGLLNLLAPTALKAISTANPIAGMATNLIAKKLNIPVSSTVEEIETHLEQHPEKHEELQSVELEIKKLTTNLEGFKVETEDRQDARKMQVTTRDWTPKIFAVMALSGFLIYCFLITVRPPLDAAIPNLIIGALTSLVSGVSAFYFGSTHNGNK